PPRTGSANPGRPAPRARCARAIAYPDSAPVPAGRPRPIGTLGPDLSARPWWGFPEGVLSGLARPEHTDLIDRCRREVGTWYASRRSRGGIMSVLQTGGTPTLRHR